MTLRNTTIGKNKVSLPVLFEFDSVLPDLTMQAFCHLWHMTLPPAVEIVLDSMVKEHQGGWDGEDRLEAK